MSSILLQLSPLEGGAWGVKWEKLGALQRRLGERGEVGGTVPHLAEPTALGWDKCDGVHTFVTDPT